MTKLFNRQGVERRPSKGFAVPTYQTTQPCSRCGGAGGAEAWRFTGWTCYRCGGKCVDPSPIREKLYTAEQNAKLDAAQAKRNATKAAKQAELDRIENLRRDAERAEIISAHKAILQRLMTHTANEEDDSATKFLREMTEQIMDARDKEAIRKAATTFIGEIGERREFTLTIGRVFSDCVSQFPTIWSHTVYCRTDEGCTVVYRGGNVRTVGHKTIRACDDDVYPVGRKVKVKATVKKHYTSAKGERVTVIQRPKLIEVIEEGELPREYTR